MSAEARRTAARLVAYVLHPADVAALIARGGPRLQLHERSLPTFDGIELRSNPLVERGDSVAVYRCPACADRYRASVCRRCYGFGEVFAASSTKTIRKDAREPGA